MVSTLGSSKAAVGEGEGTGAGAAGFGVGVAAAAFEDPNVDTIYGAFGFGISFGTSLAVSLAGSFFAAGLLSGSGAVGIGAGGVGGTCANAPPAAISKPASIDMERRSFMSGVIPVRSWLF